MLLLALDGAEAACSVALWDAARPDDEALLGYRRLAAARGQADQLVGLIDAVMAAVRLDYHALGAVAVNHGPGGFTGLRSAVAAARGLALAADLPVLAVTSLEALAAAVPDGSLAMIVAALDARRGEVYAQVFDHQKEPLTAPAAASPEEVASWPPDAPLRLVGSGARLVGAALPRSRSVAIETAELDARAVARCAARRLASGATPGAGNTVRPLYLRPPDARPQAPRFAPPRAQAVGA